MTTYKLTPNRGCIIVFALAAAKVTFFVIDLHTVLTA